MEVIIMPNFKVLSPSQLPRKANVEMFAMAGQTFVMTQTAMSDHVIQQANTHHDTDWHE